MDSRHFNVFFATYRAFGTPNAVAQHLMGWFERLDNDDCGSRSSISIQSSIRSISEFIHSLNNNQFAFFLVVCWIDVSLLHMQSFNV